jgi:molybdate transport system regulatory protein
MARETAFVTPPGLKLLSSEQLDTLARALSDWRQAAKGSRSIASRTRLYLVFLVLRHAGASLREALAIDDRKDFDPRAATVALGKVRRTVPLPGHVTGEIRALLEDPLYQGMRGSVLRLDPGYVRRQLYDRATTCGIPKDCVGPRVIRASRAVELLRGGVPMPVVQAQLGLATATTTAALVHYDEPDVARICRAFLRQEARAKTSARNVFAAVVTRLRRGSVLTAVHAVTPTKRAISTIVTNHSVEHLGLQPGVSVEASVKAPLVMIAASTKRPRCSADNVWRGKITSVEDDGCVAEVVLLLDGGEEVCAVVGADQWHALALKEGSSAWALIDASAVVLTVE